MRRAAAIVTDKGGRTAHAAIVSREFGLPCGLSLEGAIDLIEAPGRKIGEPTHGFNGGTLRGEVGPVHRFLCLGSDGALHVLPPLHFEQYSGALVQQLLGQSLERFQSRRAGKLIKEWRECQQGITFGENSEQLAVMIDYRQTADAAFDELPNSAVQRRIGARREGSVDHDVCDRVLER